MKQYEFTCDAIYQQFGVVTADSIEEARQKIIDGQYDDIIDSSFMFADYDTLSIEENEAL